MNKCKKFLISDSLREWSENSTTEFIDESKDKELIDMAKKHNILIPSPDISIFKTIYARVDVPNKNNVVISKESVIKGLPSLISKQINLEHQGSGYICGFILDAKLEGDFIVIYGCFYKSLFQDKFEQLKELIKEKKASVSFEIWNISPDTKKSVVKEKDNGIKEIDPIIFHGCGLLLEHEPACKEAYLSKLLAKKENEKDRIFSEELVYATLTIKEECVNCGKCNCEKEELIVGELKDKQISEETKTDVKPVETKPVEGAETKTGEPEVKETKEIVAEAKPEEVKVEEPKVEATPEIKAEAPMQVIEPKVIVKITSEYRDVYVDTYVDGTPSGTSVGKSYFKKVTEYKDGTKDEVESESEFKKKYDFAELEEAVRLAKEELANLHKTELEAKTNEVKVDLEKKITEKETEISNLKKELDAKAQEIAELKTPKVEVAKEEPIVEVGSTEKIEKDNYYKERQKKINKIAYGHE